MKLIRHIATAAFLTLGVFGAVTYTSCNKDACKGVTCNHGGTCSGGNCTCPTGYEGTRCDTLSRDKFLGVYNGMETCTTGTDSYAVTLSSSSNNLTLNLSNLYNQGFTAVCTVTGTNTFTFSGSSASTTFSGNGTLVNNQLTVAYTIANGGTSNSCSFVGNK